MSYFDGWVSAYLKREGSVVRVARDKEGILLGVAIIGLNSTSQEEEEEEEEEGLPRWKRCPEKMQKWVD